MPRIYWIFIVIVLAIQASEARRKKKVPDSFLEGSTAQTTKHNRDNPGQNPMADSEERMHDTDQGTLSANDTAPVITTPTTDDCKPREKDCMGVCFGPAVLDACLTCNGNNQSCKDCKGVINGKSKRDRSGNCCLGKDIDCKGDCMGTAAEDKHGECCYANQKDDCGICYGKNKCLDCYGTPHGTAFFDDCAVCSGGLTQHTPNTDKDCAGICFGEARTDDCNVCSGGTTGHKANSNKDCRQVCFGPAIIDECGDCEGGNMRCKDCKGIPNGGHVLDMCLKCGGDNSTCCGAYGNCNNRGKCIPDDMGSCLCDLGWGGKFCTIKQDMCRWQYCGEHGSCNPMTGACTCDPGFIGDHCECGMCSGNGAPDPSNGCTCTCRTGFTGPDCSLCEAPSIDGYVYVCISKYGQDINNRVIDEDASRGAGMTVLEPLKFMLAAVSRESVGDVLTNNHALTQGKNKIAILPGTSINGTVYSCNCQATDVMRDSLHKPDNRITFSRGNNRREKDGSGDDITTREGGGGGEEEEDPALDENGIHTDTDAIAIRAYLLNNPLSDKEKDTLGTVESRITRYKRFLNTRALTLPEAEGFLQQLFNFFNIDIDVTTGTPETVGNGVDQIEQNTKYERISCVVYFIVSLALVVLCLVAAIIMVLFITGGSLVSTTAMAGGDEGGDYPLESSAGFY